MTPVTGDNCPWCYFPSQPKERICRRCGHFAHVNQLYCECAPCLVSRPRVVLPFGTMPFIDWAGIAATPDVEQTSEQEQEPEADAVSV